MGGSNTKTMITQCASSDSQSFLALGDSTLKKDPDTPVQTALKAAGKAIESGSDIITAPIMWLKEIQKNALTYLILIAIILLTITFLYCAIRYSLCRCKKRDNSINKLTELVSVIVDKNSATRGPLTALPFESTSIAPTTTG